MVTTAMAVGPSSVRGPPRAATVRPLSASWRVSQLSQPSGCSAALTPSESGPHEPGLEGLRDRAPR